MRGVMAKFNPPKNFSFDESGEQPDWKQRSEIQTCCSARQKVAPCRCCHKHDCCYAKAEDQGCHTKVHVYPWSCDSQPLDCGSLTDRCEKMLCLCDREAARCLKKAPYNLKYFVWPDFLCGPELPTCAYY